MWQQRSLRPSRLNPTSHHMHSITIMSKKPRMTQAAFWRCGRGAAVEVEVEVGGWLWSWGGVQNRALAFHDSKRRWERRAAEPIQLKCINLSICLQRRALTHEIRPGGAAASTTGQRPTAGSHVTSSAAVRARIYGLRRVGGVGVGHRGKGGGGAQIGGSRALVGGGKRGRGCVHGGSRGSRQQLGQLALGILD